MSYRLFLSHGAADNYFVENLLQPKLQATGATVFVDKGALTCGDDFRSRIFTELRLCDELLVFLTDASITRPWVAAEIGYVVVRETQRIAAMTYMTDVSQLDRLGFKSLLGHNEPFRIDQFEIYLNELRARIENT